METNGDHKNNVPEEILHNAMGRIFSRAGYDCLYGGKIHLPGPSPVYEKVEPYGFKFLTADYRVGLARTASEFLKQKHETPFLLSLAFVNPHDICYYAYNRYRLAKGKSIIGHNGTLEWDTCNEFLAELEGLSEEEMDKVLLPLPDNFEIPERELISFRMDKPAFMCYSRNNFTEKDWRIVRYLYRRFVNKVDCEIGELLDVFYRSEYADNTVIVFTSDHGEMYGSHRTDEKAYLYEECTKVPLMLSWKEGIKPGYDDESLVSGLDILPTLCELCGISVPLTYEGESLQKLMQGKTGKRCAALVVENSLSRLVIMGDKKYMVATKKPLFELEKCADCTNKCDFVNPVREQVTDLSIDPGEMQNFASDPAYAGVIKEGRRILRERNQIRGIETEEQYIF